MIVEELIGSLIPPCFPGTVIEMDDSLLYLLPGYLPKICSLREKLAKPPVGIFIDASFPRGIRMGKIGGGLQGTGNPFMFLNSSSKCN